MPNDTTQYEDRIAKLEYIINEMVKSERYEFARTLQHNGAKLGFFSRVAVKLYSLFYNSGNVAGAISFAAGGTWTANTTTNGGIGSTYYFIPDIVRALKQYGLLEE